MKNFVKENWYKLMIGSSLFIFSVGFLIQSVTPAYSKPEKKDNINKASIQVPINEDGSINVKLSPEQINEIKSSSGSLQKIGDYYYIGCGQGIFHTRNPNPISGRDWSRVYPL